MKFSHLLKSQSVLWKIVLLSSFIILPILTFYAGMKYRSKMRREEPIKQTKTEAQVLLDNSDKEKATKEKYQKKQVESFKENFLSSHQDFAKEIQNELINSATPIATKEWIIQTELKGEVTPDRKGRFNHYIVRDHEWKNLTPNGTICVVENFKVVEYDNNIPQDTPLKEDMLLLYGNCPTYGSYRFVTLYKYASLDQVPFKGGNVDEYGSAKGIPIEITGKDPVVVIDYRSILKTEELTPSGSESEGIGVYSLRTGALLDSFLYKDF